MSQKYHSIAHVAARRIGGIAGAALLASTMLAGPTLAQDAVPTPSGDLEKAFQDPPMSSRARVWWHWMNGNVTKEGIAKDLEWMKRSGIGGMHSFDVNLATPQIVPKRLVYMTPEWKDAFRFAASKADELGLELAIASSPGWSQTGGPWVKPHDGVKKVTWSETTVRGGRRFTGVLPMPASATGPFLDAALHENLNALAGNEQHQTPTMYADTAVLAYRLAGNEGAAMPRMSLSDGTPLDALTLNDGRFAAGVPLKQGTAENPTIINIDYDRVQTIRTATIFIPGSASTFFAATVQPRLEASDDGQTWRKVADLQLNTAPSTFSFTPVTARRFRLVLAHLPAATAPLFTPAPGLNPVLASAITRSPPGAQIVELHLSTEARINHFETKAGFSLSPDYYALDAPPPPRSHRRAGR